LGFASVKDIGEDSPDDCQRLLRSVYGDGLTLEEVEWTEVVEAEDVVGVAMCIEHGVYARKTGTQGLLAEIGEQGQIETPPRMEGNVLVALLAPKKGSGSGIRSSVSPAQQNA